MKMMKYSIIELCPNIFQYDAVIKTILHKDYHSVKPWIFMKNTKI